MLVNSETVGAMRERGSRIAEDIGLFGEGSPDCAAFSLRVKVKNGSIRSPGLAGALPHVTEIKDRSEDSLIQLLALSSENAQAVFGGASKLAKAMLVRIGRFSQKSIDGYQERAVGGIGGVAVASRGAERGGASVSDGAQRNSW